MKKIISKFLEILESVICYPVLFLMDLIGLIPQGSYDNDFNYNYEED